MTGDSITIVRAARRRLTKLWRADGGSQGYNSAKLFDLYEEPVADLDTLGVVLSRLQWRVECAVVRGGIADPTRTRSVRRLVHPDPETGDQPTVRETLRRYVNLDLDGLPLPASVDRADLAACAAAVLPLLPAEVRAADVIVQGTASHLLKPGARIRLWLWLDRPASGMELQRWFRGTPVDPSTFRPGQVTYTAAPVFEPPLTDPLPRRLLQISGQNRAVAVPPPETLAPPPRTAATVPLPSDVTSDRYAQAALNRAGAAIASASEGERHPTAVSQAWGLARLVRAGLLQESEVVRLIEGALKQAGKPDGEGVEIAKWALAQRADSGNAPKRGGCS